jgi:hypothetical protein
MCLYKQDQLEPAMKPRALMLLVAMPLFLMLNVTPSAVGDPYSVQRKILGDEAQSRLEDERRLREHNQRLDRAMRQMEQMNRGSSGQTYYLGGCDVNPNDPSCMLDQESADKGRVVPPPRPTSDPYASRPQAPIGPNCEPHGLFGAPPKECIDLSKPKPKPPPMYVGEGPCRHNKNGRGVDFFFWGDSRECLAYIKKVQTKECGCVFPQGIPRADFLYYGIDRSCSLDCRIPVHYRVTGSY